ncbi:hypothetical protein Nepgr_032748 [Nepenthes gracilis]|uniref:Vacuolar protein sorting-associated protein 62 n=1 Tax=Nepenthes gracilis TaxID=150966 RepID=A0AAD3TJ79_NEPGR|nr:hypothetical protein Nepgr_032748 [Nepenthes gracilis]
MFGCECLCWNSIADISPPELKTFTLPAPIPEWPTGQGFATRRIKLGELEVAEITNFEFIWSFKLSNIRRNGASFYRPVNIPDGFFSFGHYCQWSDKPLLGFVLVARDMVSPKEKAVELAQSPPLLKPVDYTLVWSSNDGGKDTNEQPGYFWLPQPPEGYKALGFVVTNKSNKPVLEEVRCVRENLTDECETCGLLGEASSEFLKLRLRVWNTRPCHRGMLGRGVSVGTFFCSSVPRVSEELHIRCLKNLDPSFPAMPNLNQIHGLINHYGPMIYFHPSEIYLPSSVAWFFKNGALLYRAGDSTGEPIDPTGSNLPGGGSNDGEFWIDFPSDNQREIIMRGDLDSAELYAHVKPALGGTFTDIAMWGFCPFNGPATLKVGLVNVPLKRIGEHVGDWEHYTLRLSNFTGKLHSIYFSQHSGGQWINACELEYVEGNKAVVYSSKSSHASYPHPGTYIQGSERLGIGVRNDCAGSEFSLDSSVRYQVLSAEYLQGEVVEVCWLQFMREWGPTIVYDSRTELDKVIQHLPLALKYSVEAVFNKLPVELYGEEGPTGPKEKNNWVGDERW